MVNLLAIETASDNCSVALQVGGDTICKESIAPREHGQLVLPYVEHLLSEAELPLSQIDAIGFGCGPGAFTGLRIAAGFVQGLAYGVDCGVIPLSSLAIQALGVYHQYGEQCVAPVFDARMDEVYWGAYRIEQDQPVALTPDQVCKPEAVSVAWLNKLDQVQGKDIEKLCVAGNGLLYETQLLEVIDRTVIDRDEPLQIRCVQDCYPSAQYALPMAKSRFDVGEVLPAEQALPVYLRDPIKR